MHNIEKLECLIREMSVYIEENERIDRVTREKLNSQIDSFYNVTESMKKEQEKNYTKLQQMHKEEKGWM